MTRFFYRYPIVIPLFFVSLFYLNLLSQPWIPVHDSLAIVRWLHVLLGHIAEFGEFALWLPYFAHGTPSDLFYIGLVHPTAYLALPIFSFFHHWNSVHLFYVSNFLSEMIFLLGVICLARSIFKERSTVLFVALSLSGSVVLSRQLILNFGSHYFVPLCCYFFHRGIQGRQLGDLCIGAGLISFFVGRGYALYPSLAGATTCFVFLGVLWVCERAKVRQFVLDISIIKSCIGLSLAVASLSIFLHMSAGIPSLDFSAPGRVNQVSGYETFLTFQLDPHSFDLAQLFGGLLAFPDTTLYTGILILPLLFVGVVFAPQRKQIPLVVCLLLLFLAWAGPFSFFAPLLYHVPGAPIYRHLSHLGPIIKLFIVFLAGFGWQQLLESFRLQNNRSRAVLSLFLSVTGILFLFCFFRFLSTQMLVGAEHFNFYRIFILTILVVSLLILVLSFHFNRTFSRHAPITFLIFACIDVYTFRFSQNQHDNVQLGDDHWQLYQTHSFAFQKTRLVDYFESENFAKIAPSNSFANLEAYTKANLLDCQREGIHCQNPKGGKFGEMYSDVEQFLGFDACHSIFRGGITLKRVVELNDRWGLPKGTERPLLAYKDLGRRRAFSHAGYLRLSACGFPKFQTVMGVTQMDDDAAVLQRIAEKDFDGKTLTATRQDFEKLSLGEVSDSDTFPGSRSAQYFTYNQVGITLPKSKEDRWLYYSDAWDPRWKAQINERPVPILRVNHAYKAVKVPPQESNVVFYYDSKTSKWVLWFNAIYCVSVVISILSWGIVNEKKCGRMGN